MSTKYKFLNGQSTAFNTALPSEITPVGAPVYFYDDFLGAYFQKYAANENTVAPWVTTETNLNTPIGLVADGVNGVVQITIDADDNAEVGYIGWNGQEALSMNQGLVWEARIAVHTLPTADGAETTDLLWGLSGAYNADPDAVDVNAWFRMVGTAAGSTAVVWETDDNVTNDDDNAISGLTIVADEYHIYRIECTGTVAGDDQKATFYVDGSPVGTGTMAGLTAATGLVQPVLWGLKTKTVKNVSVGAIYCDYVKCWQNRT